MTKAFHGSPKLFDQFTELEIGSGDGKSQGGHGIYFSAIPEVAEEYALKGGALYTVAIKDECTRHRWRWLNLDEQDEEEAKHILDGMPGLLTRSDIKQFRYDLLGEESGYDLATGEQIYQWIYGVLGSDKAASNFLMSIGYVGNVFEVRGTMRSIAYGTRHPEYYVNGKALNYTVFCEADIEIIDTKNI